MGYYYWAVSAWTDTEDGKGDITMRDDFNWPYKPGGNKKGKEKVAQRERVAPLSGNAWR